jgi:hypothetical protein
MGQLYYEWSKQNLGNENVFAYDRWEDDRNTYILGSYDRVTGKGIERKFVLESEYEIDKSDDIKNDTRKYQE